MHTKSGVCIETGIAHHIWCATHTIVFTVYTLSFRVVKSEPDVDWAEHLTFPARFSADTLAGIESGIPTQRARNEIIDSLATLMLVHTRRPIPDDLTTICHRLVEKYPTLRDKVNNGYVSTYKTFFSHQLK